jgi:hypothetical protein
MIAYIQKQNGEWLNENCYAAQYGFNRMGYDVKSFEHSDISRMIFENPDEPVVGGINALNFILSSNNIKIPDIPNISEHIPRGYLRDVYKSTLGDIRNNKIEPPFFVKPLESFKLFTGFVYKSRFDLNKISNLLVDETPLLISEVVNFESEYRCFILNGELIGCKNYTGDYKILPNFKLIDLCINDYKNAPVAYTLDFGILDTGSSKRTELIEINDGYGFGAYGLNPILYCKMISKRWKDIFTNKRK